jgi:c(7)-type cytochrome triheme protein
VSRTDRNRSLSLLLGGALCVLAGFCVFVLGIEVSAEGGTIHEITQTQQEGRDFSLAPAERNVYRDDSAASGFSSVGARYYREQTESNLSMSLLRSSKDNLEPRFYKHSVPTGLAKANVGEMPMGNSFGPFPQGPELDYSTFKHTSQRHTSLACTACHQRGADNSAKPAFPGHSACINCHGNQFFSSSSPMCSICHSDVNTAKPPLRSFPTNFNERFNVRFDHAQHMSAAARPKNGCAACHTTGINRGVGLSIPTGLNAHTQCYGCHTPASKSSAGRDLASCGVCHEQKSYARTSTNGPAFRASFSHAKHGPRQRLECAACHLLTPGAAQGKQVSSPRAAEHFSVGAGQSCESCHNGKRSFGGDLAFKDCRRCHSGASFRLPG